MLGSTKYSTPKMRLSKALAVLSLIFLKVGQLLLVPSLAKRFHRVWQQYIGRFITVRKSGILTLTGITDWPVSSFFRVPLFKRVGGLRVVCLLGLSSSLGLSRWCC